MSEQVERKPFLLKDALDILGMGNLYCPNGFTTFTATCKCGAFCRAQSMWLAKQLPRWVALLNEESGSVVLASKIKFAVEKRVFGGYNIDSAIILDLAIKGGLMLEKIPDEDLKMAKSGQIRKYLAEKVLEVFPPPFNHSRPSYAAKWPMTFCTILDSPFPEVNPFLGELELRLQEYEANFLGVQFTIDRKGIFSRIEFNEDKTPEKITSFLVMWDDFFRVHNFVPRIPLDPILPD